MAVPTFYTTEGPVELYNDFITAHDESSGCGNKIFLLIESRTPPYNSRSDLSKSHYDLARELTSSHTEFVGASNDELRAFYTQLQRDNPLGVQPRLFAVLDERSVKDRTVIMHHYVSQDEAEWEALDREQAELLPSPVQALRDQVPCEKWYSWRVRFEDAFDVYSDWSGTEQPERLFAYFRKPELVDQKGLLDMKAVDDFMHDCGDALREQYPRRAATVHIKKSN